MTQFAGVYKLMRMFLRIFKEDDLPFGKVVLVVESHEFLPLPARVSELYIRRRQVHLAPCVQKLWK